MAAEGYELTDLSFASGPGGTTTVRVEVQRPIDYLFPIPTLLPGTITGDAQATLISGVTGPGR